MTQATKRLRRNVPTGNLITPRRQAFLRAYTRQDSPTYGNMAASCRATGMHPVSTSRWWKETRADPERAGYLRQLMDENGLTDDFLFGRNRDLVASHEGADVAAGLRLAYQVKGHIKPPAQIAQLFVALQVSGEDELRQIVSAHRALGDYGLADAERDAVEALRLVLREHPERAAEIRSALFAEREITPETNGVPHEQGQGTLP